MKERVKIYRAMSPEEAKKTKFKPAFKSKNKWFSLSIDHIKERVQDGCFNNSGFKNQRYSIILEFEIFKENLQHFIECGRNELMLNIQKEQFISWCNIKVIN